MFNLFFPLLQISVFFGAVGGDPKNLPLAIVNDEASAKACQNYTETISFVSYYNDTDCRFRELSCRLINELDDPMIDKKYYTSVDKALDDVKHGKVIGVVYFHDNFTESFQLRTDDSVYAEDNALNFSEIKVWLDMSNRQLGMTLKIRLLKKYVDFSKSLYQDCRQNEKLAVIPVRFNDPVFGSEDEVYTVFMTPALLLTIVFFVATTMTSTIIITERLEGVWDRSLVAGVSTIEIILSHLLSQVVVVILQVIELAFATFVLFKTENMGDYVSAMFFLLLQGICGMCFGFLISVASTTHTMANFVSTGSFYPMVLICGMVWPLEAMPTILQWISLCTPFTIPIISFRNIITKGWTISDPQVYNGYGLVGFWIAAFIVLSIWGLKSKT